MPNWGSIMTPYGEYISEPFDISSDLDRYIAEIEFTVLNIHDQQADFYFSVSNDMNNWSSWKTFYEQSSDFLNDYRLDNLYFRYKIVMSSDSIDKRPYLQSITIKLEPYILIENIGDIIMKPKIWIRKVNGRGDIRIKNQMSGQEMTLLDIHNNEEVFVDCENEDIISSFQSSGIYRYDSHNDEWLEFEAGESYIKGYGDFDMDIRYQGKLLQD